MRRRRESRLSVYLPGTYECGSDGPRHVEVAQLSSNGCRLAEQGSPLALGDAIRLSFGAVETVDATVKWMRDELIGVEFGVPLDDIIVSFFAAYCSKAA